MNGDIWHNPPANFEIEANQVHLWLLDLNWLGNQTQISMDLLSEDECLRASKFRFEHLQKRFILYRGSLRIILSKYLSIPPKKIKFIYEGKGKPHLEKQLNKRQIEFNLSHSESMAVIGVAKKRIGVDLEKIKPNREIEGIACRFFSGREYRNFCQLKPPQKQESFLRAWTSKEAYLKATGEGLSGGLDRVEIDLGAHPRKLLSIKGSTREIENWYLGNIEIDQDYIATFAIESAREPRVNYYSFGKHSNN